VNGREDKPDSAHFLLSESRMVMPGAMPNVFGATGTVS